jgi:hypothetical protein
MTAEIEHDVALAQGNATTEPEAQTSAEQLALATVTKTEDSDNLLESLAQGRATEAVLQQPAGDLPLATFTRTWIETLQTGARLTGALRNAGTAAIALLRDQLRAATSTTPANSPIKKPDDRK